MQLNESQTRIPKCLRIVKFFPGLKELDSARYFNICFSFFFRKGKIITKIVFIHLIISQYRYKCSLTFQALALRENLFTYIYYTHIHIIHIYTYIHIYIYTYIQYKKVVQIKYSNISIMWFISMRQLVWPFTCT